ILTDTFGDGWNGNTMNVTQNGVVVAVLSLATGNGATVPVSLCDGPFELFWNAGGNWAGEVGVSVVNSFGQTIYVKDPGTGTPNSLLFSGVVTCNEPTCLPPSNLTVTSPTLDSATFNWTPGGAETSWHVIALPNGSPAPTAATTGWTEVTTAPPFVLGGLEAGTAYDFYIRADCPGDPVSQWAGPLDFNTVVCAAADQCNYTFTLTDSFGDGWNGNTMTIFQGGVPVATIGSTFTTGAGPVTVTVPLCNGVAFDLVRNTGGSFAGEVGVSITSFLGESLFTHVPGTNLQGQTLYSGTGECVPPTCLKPTNVEVSNIGLNSVTVTWQDNNTPAATSWDVLVLPASAPAPTPASTGWVNVDENPYTINGLDAATLYKVYVRAVCSDTDSSFWSLGTQFGTLICLPSNLCEYTFVMVDTFGDSWNGNTMNVTQNGILVTTLTGPTNADDTNPVTVTVSLCNDVPFELFWNTGGSFAGEVGVSIVNQDGTTVFTHTPGTNLQGTQLFAGTVQCVPFTCPKPVQLAVSDVGETSATFNWVESGTATTWQILVIPAGSPIPTPGTPFTVEVTENPYTINNLDSGTAYVFYVRAVCADDDISNWSGPIPFNTLITNDECVNAIEVPVNPDQSCAQTVNGTIIGATASSQPNTCFGTDDDDVWFQFTATSSQHNITFSNFGGSTSDLMHVVYSGNCDGTLTQLVCSDPEQSVVTGLAPGETYLIRVYSWTGTPNQTSTFTICIGTIPPPIIVTQTDYTQVQLIQDVLLNSTCASASNITWSTGTNFGSTNGIGYFERNGADFPFENGIVLSTGNAAEAPGPNLDIQSNGNDAWPGDADLEAVLAAQGINDETNNATIFEFDFIPITNSISFRFVFASEEYGVFQ
ncbi:MAG TPA: fibronectin type III domain-containing protein, partial [Flavobacterium sp.]|nr:fibronectin type III domain-containing protein [Flavobacterium sp.]